MRASLLIAALALSCGGPIPDAGDQEVAGKRLQRMVLMASDGTRTLQGWYFDTKLQAPCSFTALDAGDVWYCIPQGTRWPLAQPDLYVSARLAVVSP